MSSAQSVVRKPRFSKSNVELVNGLRSNIMSSQHHAAHTSESISPTYLRWTTQQEDTLFVPSWKPTSLAEPRESYDITVKLFYLPRVSSLHRCTHTQEAIQLVLRTLNVDSVDLLIVSFPGVAFDAEDDVEAELSADESVSTDSDEQEALEAQVQTWEVLEALHTKGTIKQLGLAEFSSDRLEKFLPQVRVAPTVDQINVKDCCVVPRDLIMYTKERSIELLTHSDCTDILPAGTTRELLGPGEKSANIIAAKPDADETEPGLKGDVEPQWVIKYTAVVKDRGVIENKGYLAAAQLVTERKDKQ